MLHKECLMRPQPPPPLELTQPCLLKLKLKLKPRLRLKLKPVLEPVPPLKLVPMLLRTRVHNTLLNKNLMEVSLSMFSNKEQELNVLQDRPPRFNIPVLSLLMVKFSIHLFQEANQLLSLLVR